MEDNMEKDINLGKWYRPSDDVWLDKLNHCIVGNKYNFHNGGVEIIVRGISINVDRFRDPYSRGCYATVTFDYTDPNRQKRYHDDNQHGHTTMIEHFWNGSWGRLRDYNLKQLEI